MLVNDKSRTTKVPFGTENQLQYIPYSIKVALAIGHWVLAIGHTKPTVMISFGFLVCHCLIPKATFTEPGTVKPQCNEPLYNEVLGITNDFLYPTNSKICGTGPRNNQTSL